MLDAPLSLRSGIRLPPFTASYIESRVKKEQSTGNPRLVCIRLIAERLATESRTVDQTISSLCELAAPKVSYIFSPHRGPSRPLRHDYFDSLLQVAAIRLSHEAVFASYVVPPTDYEFFGTFEEAAVKSRSLQPLQLYLRGASRSSDIYHLLRTAIYDGGIDAIRYIYEYDAKGNGFLKRARGMPRWLRASRPEIWDYVIEKNREYGHQNQAWWQRASLKECIKSGWTGTARHLLELYGEILETRSRSTDETYLFYAASRDHVELVKLFLERDISSRNSALKAAALNGHEEIFQLLYTHIKNTGADDITGAVVAAAKGGHLNIIKILLEGGADANESDEELPSICYAILNEHTAMYECLLDHGASVPTLELQKKCTMRAEGSGKESMLKRLEWWYSAQPSTGT
jgi:hypothetical protein